MKRLLTSCLIVLTVTTVRASAEPVPRLLEEYWESAHLDGVKIGSTHTTVHAIEGDAGKVIRTASSFDITLRRGNALLKLRVEQGTDETPDGKVVAVSMKQI